MSNNCYDKHQCPIIINSYHKPPVHSVGVSVSLRVTTNARIRITASLKRRVSRTQVIAMLIRVIQSNLDYPDSSGPQ